MNLSSLTLSLMLRSALMVAVVSGLYLWYDHAHTQAVFKRTVDNVMFAMDQQLAAESAKTRCLHAPSRATIDTLVREGWLSQTVLDDSPWTLGMSYHETEHRRVVSKVLTLTASDDASGETLKTLGHTLPGSWRYQGRTLTLLNVVNGPANEVDRMEYDPMTACFAWLPPTSAKENK